MRVLRKTIVLSKSLYFQSFRKEDKKPQQKVEDIEFVSVLGNYFILFFPIDRKLVSIYIFTQ